MKVLIIGGGGRCHAIADALGRDPQVKGIICAPGNAGIARIARTAPIRETDVDALLELALREGVGLTVVGPEAALAAGLADRFRENGLPVFGPSAAAARIETSKEFAKRLMLSAGIPTASYRAFTDYAEAAEWVRANPLPTVIKYDGLAAGKGVVVARTYAEADKALRDMLVGCRFGEGRAVVEEYLEGPEFSLMCFVSGRQVWPMPAAQDHKRAFDGDRGPNTGGMGAYAPLPFLTDEDVRYALERIMVPAAGALADMGCPFNGVLYGGLVKTAEGIKVIEFNARFGDPETEAVLPLLESPAGTLLRDIALGRPVEPRWSADAVCGVVLAAEGYPGPYRKGMPVRFPERPRGTVYHMGTAESADGTVTAGGRVAICVGRGATLQQAREAAMADAAAVECDGLFYRTDIGWQAGLCPARKEKETVKN